MATALQMFTAGTVDRYAFFQVPAVRRMEESLRQGKRALLVSDTGTGKTHMFTKIARCFPDVKVQIITPTRETAEQCFKTAASYGEEVSYILAGEEENRDARIFVGTRHSVMLRPKVDAGLLLFDEAHHLPSDENRELVGMYPNAMVGGCSATPIRLDNRGLGDDFDEMIIATTPAQMIAQGILSPLRLLSIDNDHDPQTRELGGCLVENILHYCCLEDGSLLRGMLFARDVADCIWSVNYLNEHGISAAYIDGTTPRRERRQTLAKWRRGEIRVLCSVGIFYEGLDEPTLEFIADLAPTSSLQRHRQKGGRLARTHPDKRDAIYLDFCGNLLRHGDPLRTIHWQLTNGPQGENDSLGLRRCGGCQFLFSASLKCCPECGRGPQSLSALKSQSKDGKGLLKLYKDEFSRRQMMVDEWASHSEAMGYNPNWPARQYYEMFNEWPVLAGKNLVDVERATTAEKREVYRSILANCRRKGCLDGAASHRYKEIFGAWPRTFKKEVAVELTRAGIRANAD